MSTTRRELDELCSLLLLSAAGDLDVKQHARLEGMLSESPEVRDYALGIIEQMAILEWNATETPTPSLSPTAPRHVRQQERSAKSKSPQRSVNGWLMVACSVLLGVTATLATLLYRTPGGDEVVELRPPAIATPDSVAARSDTLGAEKENAWVARLTRATPDATWSDASGPQEFLLRLKAGQVIELLSGLAEVEFASGAIAIMHGPSVLIPTGPDSAILESGRVTGRAEDGNFRLATPSAEIVDLGTEFGVSIDEASNTNVVVFEGEVIVAPSNPTNRRVESIFLDHGATACIGSNGELATGVEVEWEDFERVVPVAPTTADQLLEEHSLSVVDLVNGGDGKGEALAGAIDALTGTWDQRPWRWTEGPGYIPTDFKFHHSQSHPAIDGVFVPSPHGARTIATSAGHAIDLPETMGVTFGPIWARRRGVGELPTTTGDFWGTGTLPFILRRIGTARVGAIGMHPNVGITFDLKQCTHGLKSDVIGFEATLVNLDLAQELKPPEELKNVPERTADFWIYVDGALKYSRENFGRDLEGEDIRLELSPGDRFLTLVSTDGGTTISFDHVLLIDPMLTLSDPGETPATKLPAK
ncbi:hypothetical protein [Aeoliella sp. SH292]|uniref:hypothetical protein n=1 Tax=Aeoliella sp. SH292 TaxID=3454464 RepID=UPI003F955419